MRVFIHFLEPQWTHVIICTESNVRLSMIWAKETRGTNVALTAGVGVSVTSYMTGTEVDNNWSHSPKKTGGTYLFLAADQTWEDCNPARSHREEKTVESLDGRGKAEHKERDGELA